MMRIVWLSMLALALGCSDGVDPISVAAGDADTSCPDADNDGYLDALCGGDDCNDADAGVHPGAPEVCDVVGIDEDCNGQTVAGTDDGDEDGDGYISDACCNGAGSTLRCGNDCNDAQVNIHPGRLDGCGGGDEDCDGEDDNNPDVTFYRDSDEDTYGNILDTVLACAAPQGYVDRAGDCDDTNPDANPGVAERCDNSFDDNCIDGINEGCPCTYGVSDPIACGPTTDEGACEFGQRACQQDGTWGTCEGEVLPASEVCDESGVDEDCDGAVNEGCACTNGHTQWCQHPDAAAFQPSAQCTRVLQVCTNGAWDPPCEPSLYVGPGVEVCDSLPALDEDCDGTANVVGGVACGCTEGEQGSCGTDVGVCTSGTQTCGANGQWGACQGSNTGSAEVCDHLDNDCDNVTDDGFWTNRCQHTVTGAGISDTEMVCAEASGSLSCNTLVCANQDIALGHLCGFSYDYRVAPTAAFTNATLDFPSTSFDAQALVALLRTNLTYCCAGSGEVGLLLTPEPFPGDATAAPHGLPTLQAGHTGIAAFYHVGSQTVALYKLRPLSPPQLLATGSATGCEVRISPLVGYISLAHDFGQFTATMRFTGSGACVGMSTVSYYDTALTTELFGDNTYDTYYVGAMGHEDAALYAQLVSLDVDTYGSCSCPW